MSLDFGFIWFNSGDFIGPPKKKKVLWMEQAVSNASTWSTTPWSCTKWSYKEVREAEEE